MPSPDNIRFDLYVEDDDPNSFVLIEEWPSQEALQHHAQQDYLLALREAFQNPDLVADGRDIWRQEDEAGPPKPSPPASTTRPTPRSSRSPRTASAASSATRSARSRPDPRSPSSS